MPTAATSRRRGRRVRMVAAVRSSSATMPRRPEAGKGLRGPDVVIEPVDADLAKLVLDHRNLLAVRRRQDVVEERRLPGTQKATQNCDGHGDQK